MGPMVVLSLALAVGVTAAAGLAVLQVLKAVGTDGLGGAVKTAEQRLRPLADELRDELAITSAEVEAVTAAFPGR